MSIIEGRNAEILQSIIDGTPYENPNPYPSRIEQLLMELKEVIEQGGGGATVDQTYTPTSENAQSGTAVAEALETIPTATVDQTFNASSANAQSGVAVQEAISGDKYRISFPQYPVATVVSSLPFTAPDASTKYVNTYVFHLRQVKPSTLPKGTYLAYSYYGVIRIGASDTDITACGVVTDYTTYSKTVGNTETIHFGILPAIKV